MPHLIKPLLLDERPLVRESAAKIAGYFGYSNCADLLLKSCSDEDERVRKAAVEHLPYLEDERVPQVLAETLKTDTPKVRAAAAAAMGIVEGAESNLISALKDEDPWVRYFASQSLGRLGNPNAVSALIEVAHSDSFNHVRIAAIQSLGKLGGQSSVEAIRKQLGSTDKDVARVAAEALEEVRKPGVD
jgi:HEAT repeat protein